MNIGVIILQMNKFGQKIREAIKHNNAIINKLEMNETELKKHLEEMKKKVFEAV